MEININSNGLGNIGVGREPLTAKPADAGRKAIDASKTSDVAFFNVSTSSARIQSDGLASSEPVADVPDSALTRDDELGRLVNGAFNMPPPPMPTFAD